ncbi:alpha/beta hydrolase [Paractinoplanes lichenicola]|uniref:Alpha/beta fold hydrolase n=1 Tax=Paractinoplanes lichenicola TaxID=2802976 RepID=A0ABS1W064_9ACTN|nr:alpha/beta hydrolase [Actinoplanes lichenicola]MBL7260095.1 alpha/beta fold hydrolase [Actinoplanes lichenicola]
MKTKRHGAGPGLALTVTIGLAGVWAAPVASAAPPAWGACPEAIAAAAPGMQCSTVTVPLDYQKPAGEKIELTISRIASANPAKRRGVLLLNPGGPGVSGLTMPSDLVNRGIPNSVLDAYDLIGLDPRGVGHSSPVDCKFTVEQNYPGNVPPWAEDAATVAADAKAAKAVADQCAANDTGNRMAHMSTANTARDLDRIRSVLGEEKASFFGASYGSALGAAYASMFPHTTDRVLLDSNLGDTALTRESQRRYGLGMEQAFPGFARWAADRHDAYGLGRTPKDVRRTYFALAERLDEQPVAGLDGRFFRQFTYVSLFNKTAYGILAQLWQSLNVPAQATETAAAAQPHAQSNFLSAYLAVACNDSVWPSDVAVYQRDVAEDRKKFPMFGAAAANISPCAFWSRKSPEPQVEINDRGPANILILQNRLDLATPLVGAQLLRRDFAQRSRLVTVDDNQHGVYVFGGNACALNVGTAWLVDGKLPRDSKCR